MRKRIFIYSFIYGLFLLMLCTSAVVAEKAGVLKGITDPRTMTADGDRLYITEKSTVWIYSLDDLGLVKCLGNSEEKRGFFKGRLGVCIDRDGILVNSRGKTSSFDKNGVLLREDKEKSFKPSGRHYTPLGKGYVVRAFKREFQANFLSAFFFVLLSDTGTASSGVFYDINIADGNKWKIKELMSYNHPYNAGQFIDPVNIRGRLFRVYGDMLYLEDGSGGLLVYDSGGNKRGKLEFPLERVRITEKHKKRYRRAWMTLLRNDYERHLRRFRFREYFPSMRDFFVADGRIYVLTFNERQRDSEMVIFSLEGELLKRVWVPLAREISLVPAVFNRYTVNNGKLYGLVHNEEGEFELHVMGLD